MKSDKEKVLTLPAYNFKGTIEAIQRIIYAHTEETRTLANTRFKGDYVPREENLRQIWAYCRQNIKYKLDKPLYEEIRTPAQTWAARTTGVDCEDFVIYISTILRNKNIPHSLRVADYGNGWAHIYIVVPGANKKRIIIDAVSPKFNFETKFVKKKDYEIALNTSRLSGLPSTTMKTKAQKEREKIAKENAILFDIDKPTQYYVSPKQLSFDFGKGLGKLPTNILTDRERFILKLWQHILVNEDVNLPKTKSGNVVYSNVTYKIKNVTSLLEFANYAKILFPEIDTKIANAYVDKFRKDGREQERTVPGRIIFKLPNGQKFGFSPEGLPELAYQIGGPEVFLKPKIVVNSKYELTPINTELIKFLKPFVSKDKDMASRAAMLGLYFNKENNEVVATDAHIMIVISGSKQNPVTETGVFDLSGYGNEIKERYPDYKVVIPDQYRKKATIKLNASDFLGVVKSVDKYSEKSKRAISLLRKYEDMLKVRTVNPDYNQKTELAINAQFSEDYIGQISEIGEIGVNGQFLINVLNGIVKYAKTTKNLDITLEITTPNRPIIIQFDSLFGKTLCLIMPVMIDDSIKDTEVYVAPKTDTGNKALMLKIAIAKAKIKIALLK